MFTGIVEERGAVAEISATRLRVAARTVSADAGIGDSIAVNGVCLTVVDRTDDGLAFDVSPETLARSSLRRLAPGDPVNLERPVSLATRLGGHLVQGHVDAVGEVTAVRDDGAGGARITVRIAGDLLRYVVEKGSITVDGVSLTVASMQPDGVDLALIPHTLAVTTLGVARPGHPVNIEVDVIAKYVAKSVAATVEPLLGRSDR